MRKLVTLRKISNIVEHTNADSLELAFIDGWQVVVKKGEFKSGQLVVYFEIDSLIPISDEFEFLRKSSYIKKDWLNKLFTNGDAFRLRTVKLRKEISQGLIVPISFDLQNKIDNENLTEFADVTDVFGVKKYDPPIRVSNSTYSSPLGKFPEFIPKTDQERVQNISYADLLEIFESEETFEVTQKYNGSSITIYQKRKDLTFFDKIRIKFYQIFNRVDKIHKIKNHFGVCSRNLELKIDGENSKFVGTALREKYDDVLKFICDTTDWDLAIQGELIGENIQSNWHGIPENTIMVFDIFNITEQRYLSPDHRRDMMTLIHGKFPEINHVYVLNTAYKLTGVSTQQFLNIAEYQLSTGKENEGIVLKSNKRQFSFKAISNKFLLNGGE